MEPREPPCDVSVFFLCFGDGFAEVGGDVIYDPAHFLDFFGCTAPVCVPTKAVDFTVSIVNL